MEGVKNLHCFEDIVRIGATDARSDRMRSTRTHPAATPSVQMWQLIIFLLAGPAAHVHRSSTHAAGMSAAAAPSSVPQQQHGPSLGHISLLKKTFGFIKSPCSTLDVFFHASACSSGCHFEQLAVGDAVSFVLHDGVKPTATDVTAADREALSNGSHGITEAPMLGVLLQAPVPGAGAPHRQQRQQHGVLCFLDNGTPRQLVFPISALAPSAVAEGLAPGARLAFTLVVDERLKRAAAASSSSRRHHMYYNARDITCLSPAQQVRGAQA
jgi:cold shock CspA family protein